MATYRITLDIEHLPEGPYLGTSPDLPGLIVQADTAEDVIRLAPEIAHDLIEVMQEVGHAPDSGTGLSF
jgi:predicted RNase H-like HicB family nuclease